MAEKRQGRKEWQGSTDYAGYTAEVLHGISEMRKNGSYRTWSNEYKEQVKLELKRIENLAMMLRLEM